MNPYENPTVPCKWCSEPTTYQRSKECGGCHQIRMHASNNLLAASAILKQLALEQLEALADDLKTNVVQDSTVFIESGSMPEPTDELERRLAEEDRNHWWASMNANRDYIDEQEDR